MKHDAYRQIIVIRHEPVLLATDVGVDHALALAKTSVSNFVYHMGRQRVLHRLVLGIVTSDTAGIAEINPSAQLPVN